MAGDLRTKQRLGNWQPQCSVRALPVADNLQLAIRKNVALSDPNVSVSRIRVLLARGRIIPTPLRRGTE